MKKSAGILIFAALAAAVLILPAAALAQTTAYHTGYRASLVIKNGTKTVARYHTQVACAHGGCPYTDGIGCPGNCGRSPMKCVEWETKNEVPCTDRTATLTLKLNNRDYGRFVRWNGSDTKVISWTYNTTQIGTSEEYFTIAGKGNWQIVILGSVLQGAVNPWSGTIELTIKVTKQ